VVLVVDCLLKRDPPPVAVLPRRSGQTAERYTHLFYEDDEQQAVAREQAMHVSARPIPATASDNQENDNAELESVHAELAELQQSIADLTSRIENIERQIG